MKHWIISSTESGIKLIDFLKQKIGSDCSARHLKRLIENKCCQVNGKTERFASAVLGAGDKVQFQWEEPLVDPKATLADPARILYEDADLFIYDKPSGIASDSPLLNQLKPSLELIHRLDKETSGVLMFAKTSKMREAMIKEFQHKNVKKTYVALVYGVPGKKKGVVDNYLGKLAQYQGQSLWGSVSAEKGLHARTEWELIKKGKETAMLTCMPITGRTHQIRVHLSGIGHPILGDHSYGHKAKSPFSTPRCCLHAFSISFTHPFTKEPLYIEAEIPEDMQSIIQQLQKSG
jgi:RluA family pseudouridine synthase